MTVTPSPSFDLLEKARVTAISHVQSSYIEKVDTRAMERLDSEAELPQEFAPQPNASFRHLFVFSGNRERTVVLSALFSSALLAGAKIAFAVILGMIFEAVSMLGSSSISASDALAQVSVYCLALTSLGAAKALTSALFMASWIVHGEARAKTVRDRLFHSLLAKTMGWFDGRPNGTASITAELQTQIRELQAATSQVLGYISCDFFVGVGCLILAFVKSWQLTLGLLASVPPSVLCLHLLGRHLEPSTTSQRQELSQAAKHAIGSLLAVDIVKVYNGYDEELWHYQRRVQNAMRYYLVQARCASSQMGFIKFWMVNLFVLGFWLGLYLVEQGKSSAGSVLTTFYAVLIAFQSVESLGTQWLTIVKGMSAGSSIEALVAADDNTPDERRFAGSIIPHKNPEDIEMIDVSFSYPSNPSKTILHRCNFFFPTHEMSFIVGRSGSGKSTIGDLLAGFYKPTAGRILINSLPSESIDTKWLRENITLIQQSSTVFNGTFAMNVSLGDKNPRRITQNRIRWACQIALLQSTVADLPDGLDTLIGSRGQALSGGQLQRLALARSQLRKPSVLILDEITSGLDLLSAKMIFDAIRLWRRGMTTIVIAHDVSQFEDSDYIYVMDDGYVVQEGYYRTLAGESDRPLRAMIDATKDDTLPCLDEADIASSGAWPFTNKDERRLGTEKRLASRVDGQSAGNGLFKRMSLLAPVGRTAPVTTTQRVPRRSSSLEELLERGQRARSRRPRSSVVGHGLPERVSVDVTHHDNSAETSKVSSIWTILQTVWPRLDGKHRLFFVLGLLSCVVVAAGNPVFSYLFAQILQVFWVPGDKEAAGRQWTIPLIGVGCVDGLAVFFSFFFMDIVAQAWVDALRTEAFNRVLHQPKSWLDEEKHSPSRIIDCLGRNAEEMRKLVGLFLPIVFIAAGMVLSSVIWALAISWNLTLVALACGPVVVGITRWTSSVSDEWETRCNQAFEATGSVFNDVFSNIRVVRALTQETYFTEELEGSAAHTFRLGLSRAWRTGLLYGATQGMSDWLSALVFFYGVKLLTYPDSQLTVDSILQVVNLLLFSIGTAAVMLGDIPQIAAAKAVATQMLDYANLSLTASHEHKCGGMKAMPIFPIKMRNLSFAYPSRPNTMVLRNLSLTINAGECIAVAGWSGGGKSTILGLLLRLYEAAEAGVADTARSPVLSFGALPARDLDTVSLRNKIGYVPQRPVLVPGTVTDNITYGLREGSPLREVGSVERAAHAAGIHAFIVSLPDGYNTSIGDGGLKLSGGQAQRICIARALLRQPSLLVMDEPTSALDAESADGIRNVIRRMMSGTRMSIVVVTHSKEMMCVAHRVVVLDGGFVRASGPYHDLISNDAKFAQMVGEAASR